MPAPSRTYQSSDTWEICVDQGTQLLQGPDMGRGGRCGQGAAELAVKGGPGKGWSQDPQAVDLTENEAHPSRGPFLFCYYYKFITWILFLLVPFYSEKCPVWTVHSLVCIEARKKPPPAAPCHPPLRDPLSRNLSSWSRQSRHVLSGSPRSLAILGSLEKQLEFVWQ